MKQFKKWLGLALCLVMLCTVFPSMLLSAHGETVSPAIEEERIHESERIEAETDQDSDVDAAFASFSEEQDADLPEEPIYETSSVIASGASFVSRSDGIWYWPLPKEKYYTFSDWAGCPGKAKCPFCGVLHDGWQDDPHTGQSAYGHNGIDVSAKNGTKVMAMAAGKVYLHKANDTVRGIYVVIEHPIGNGWSYYSYYQHLSSINSALSDGDTVTAGQEIGKTGNTGGSYQYGYHLHLGLLLGKSDLKASALSKLEGKGWVLTSGYQQGRILNNPAKNSPAGLPKSTTSTCTDNVRNHAGSVMYTFNVNEVSIGSYRLICMNNVSGKNYLYGTDLLGGTSINSKYYASRDTDVATLSVDTSARHNGYCSFKIVNKSAGSNGKDLMFKTLTNDRPGSGGVGDSKNMTLSFWAKASNAGTKMFFRWGYESSYRSVTLTKDWAYYTVPMNKTTGIGVDMHPFVDRAGTVWVAELQLEDGTKGTSFVPETVVTPFATVYQTYTGCYTLPSKKPALENRIFDGWYTAAVGGEKVTDATAVKKGDLVVYAHWKWINPFVDVKEGKYYYEPVLWAFYSTPQITKGTDDTHFSPNQTCTRAQVVSFLWNAKGKPAPASTVNPFTDIKSGKYYTDAVLWAYYAGVTTGATDTEFQPGGKCTRAQVVSFLWRAMGQPEPTSTDNPFVDVKPTKYYYKAVLWAVEQGITKGTDATHFSPSQTCTRGQVVTFLYNALK